MRYFLTLSYNGTPFHGWQRQPNAVSVQQTLEEALSTLLREELSVVAAGRTDTGVHARTMVVHFEATLSEEKENNLVHLLNRYLDENIAIHKLARVQADAHARFDALSRTYEYHIVKGKNPFQQKLAYAYPHTLDVAYMNQGAAMLLSHEDFECFSKVHTDVKTFLCDVTSAVWEETADGYVFTISANRFLRNMVRAIVGTFLDLGRHKISLEELKTILESKNRSKAGFSVPACGLYLTEIDYPQNIYCSYG